MAHPESLTKEAQLKLSIEKKFLDMRDVYQSVVGKVVESFKNDNKSVMLFERQLLDRSYFRREKTQKNRETGSRV